ncbi:MAG: T9SS type A sorting domain-containing protein [Chitinophagales bacterium]
MKKLFYFTFLYFCCSALSQAQCTTEVGILPSNTLFVCENGIENFVHNDFLLGEQDVLIYILHEESNLSASLDTLYSNEIEWRELGEINWNTAYGVTAVAGLDENEDGLPDDLNEECTVISEAMPVVFAAPVRFLFNLDCGNYFNDSLCQFVAYTKWSLLNELPYEEGNIERSFTLTNNLSNDTVQEPFFDLQYDVFEFSPSIVEFYFTDNYGCLKDTLRTDIEAMGCKEIDVFDGFAIITRMPTELQVICGESESDIRAECIWGVFGGIANYILSLSPEYAADSVLAVHIAEDGFENEDAQEYTNQELYVIGTVTENFFGNIYYSEPTPIVFLDPIAPQITVLDCNETTGTATLALSLNGGLPEFDPTIFYNIEGDIETTLQFGENTIIEVSLSESLEWELDLTVSDGSECMEVIEMGEACSVGIEENTLVNIGFSLQNLFPIPAKNDLFLQLNSNKNQSVSLQLFSFNGSKIMKQRANLELGINEIQWSLSGLPTGVYWLKITGTEGSLVEKVVVQR